MILWLDHKIFGNGNGIKSPFWDDQYFWLSGALYTWSGWYGAQLQSFQWRHPKAGERRTLCGREFVPFHSERHFLWLWPWSIFSVPLPIARVRVSWSWTALPDGIEEANAALRALRHNLGKL